MKLTVIGCWGGYPAPDQASSTYLVEKDGYAMVIDMGSGGLAKLQKYIHVLDIHAVVLSHYHADHIADVGVLQHARLVQAAVTGKEKVLPIYGHDQNVEQFHRLTDDYTEGKAYNPDEVLKIGPFFIRFLRTKHSVPCYGMRITDGDSTIVYTADTAFQKEWIPFTQNADLLLADTNFYAEMNASEAGHMTSEEVGIIAEGAKVQEVLLTHLPHFGEHEQLIQETKKVYSGKVLLAYEGLVWENKT